MTNSRTVIEKLKMQFSHPGILEIVISDNEMQYACIEFTKFASDWHFQLINSSLPNLQSNVRTIVTRLRNWFIHSSKAVQQENMQFVTAVK